MSLNEALSILRQFRQANCDKYGIKSLGIFGSYARNDENVDSDVDVVVETENPDLFAIVHIKEELGQLLGRPVDLVRKRPNMNPLLRERIERDVIYA